MNDRPAASGADALETRVQEINDYIRRQGLMAYNLGVLFDAFVMHSSIVEADGKAYCFAAESGIGKSTHTRYWKEALGDRATVINGGLPGRPAAGLRYAVVRQGKLAKKTLLRRLPPCACWSRGRKTRFIP